MAVEVKPVRTGRELGAFVRLPWRLYRDEPRWVAPLLMDVKKRLDQRKNPFFKHAQAQYFLAYRDGRPVGRISAHVDQNFNRFQGKIGGCLDGLSARRTPRRRVRCWMPPRAGCVSAAGTGWSARWTSRPMTRSVC